jgi:hypothetical protein
MQYVSMLRGEILQAQALRIRVIALKIGLLGAALTYFIQRGEMTAVVLVCPFGALLFDCMIHGLSRSIQGWGKYMKDNIEPYLVDQTGITFPLPEMYKPKNQHARVGRRFARASNFGTTLLAGAIAFYLVRNAMCLCILLGSGAIALLAWCGLLWSDLRLFPERSEHPNQKDAS